MRNERKQREYHKGMDLAEAAKQGITMVRYTGVWCECAWQYFANEQTGLAFTGKMVPSVGGGHLHVHHVVSGHSATVGHAIHFRLVITELVVG